MGDSYLLRLELGEEIVGRVSDFAADRRIDAGSISGIGSAYDVVLGYYDRQAQEYLRHDVPGEVEIISLLGNISVKEGRAFPHIHVSVAGRDYQPVAGHLFSAVTAGTCEIILRPLPGYVQRFKDEVTGLFLLDL
jgi:predicted DNA-binding protein with PD1-like motif